MLSTSGLKLSTVAWLAGFFIVFLWSAINPKDVFIWALEVSPAVIGLIILALTRESFPLTSLSYSLILIHCWILFVGAHYTYAEVPLFDSLRDVFTQSRNNYDKVGHFAQGLVPAILCREVIIRNRLITKTAFVHFFTLCFCLAISAFYEIIEWWVALLSGDAAVEFISTQGYIWDTQSDMAWALFGAGVALITLSHWHNKQITHLEVNHRER